MQLEGIEVSAFTIQKILNPGTRHHRWLMLERRHCEQTIDLTPEQIKFLEKQNPAFR